MLRALFGLEEFWDRHLLQKEENGSMVISKGILFSLTAYLMKIFRTVVIFILKSAKRESACFFSSVSVLILIFASI